MELSWQAHWPHICMCFHCFVSARWESALLVYVTARWESGYRHACCSVVIFVAPLAECCLLRCEARGPTLAADINCCPLAGAHPSLWKCGEGRLQFTTQPQLLPANALDSPALVVLQFSGRPQIKHGYYMFTIVYIQADTNKK